MVIKGSPANLPEMGKERLNDTLSAFTFCWREPRFLPMEIGRPLATYEIDP
jgi:hypothetical protein